MTYLDWLEIVILNDLPIIDIFIGIERKASSYRENLSNDQRSPVLVQLYTEALLVNLSTPDFSMPYNVMALKSLQIH